MKQMTSDKESFLLIKKRLEDDAGRLFNLASKDFTPFWVFARTLFPIAESIGALLYKRSSTENLKNIFLKELSVYNPKYGEFAALVALIYRHSLIHQDELRNVCYKDYLISWEVSYHYPHISSSTKHLELSKSASSEKSLSLHFDLRQFYEDLLRLCEDKSKINFSGLIAQRYNEWMVYELKEGSKDLNRTEKEAIEEIKKIITVKK